MLKKLNFTANYLPKPFPQNKINRKHKQPSLKSRQKL